MKDHLADMITRAWQSARDLGEVPEAAIKPAFDLLETKSEAHGDFSSNAAMILAAAFKSAGTPMPPRKVAEALVKHLEAPQSLVDKVEIAGPGFVNFFVKPAFWSRVLARVLDKGQDYGRSEWGGGEKIQVEFVSANPTGPLHVGHGRGAAVGDSLARILAFSGFDVQKEFYINDSGRQIRLLGRSVFARLLEQNGQKVEFPEDGYQGDYVKDLAAGLAGEAEQLLAMPVEEAETWCAQKAAAGMLDQIRKVLETFGVTYDCWFSEQKDLIDQNKVAEMLEDLKKKGLVYEKDGAWWFRTSDFGDDKDRVVVRATGETTYFASDIAYHHEKFTRPLEKDKPGFDRVIDVWGADHHGYIPRVAAAMKALGHDPENRFSVVLIKLVNLLRGGEPVSMGKRAGTFVTLDEVMEEVGAEAARFTFLTRQHESPLDFDLDAVRARSAENPVYYIQ
ncbi:MAG: arginine--tRNA ligase [Pseudomonadota bacterium]